MSLNHQLPLYRKSRVSEEVHGLHQESHCSVTALLTKCHTQAGLTDMCDVTFQRLKVSGIQVSSGSVSPEVSF